MGGKGKPQRIASVPFPDNSLVADGAGNLYVPSSPGGGYSTIVRIAQGSHALSTVIRPDGLGDRAIGMTIDAAGNLYVAGFNHGFLEELLVDSVGNLKSSTSSCTGNHPDGLLIAPWATCT